MDANIPGRVSIMRSEPLGGLSGSTAVGNAWLGQLKDGLQANQVLYPMVNYQDSVGQYMLSLEVGWAEAETTLNNELKKAATSTQTKATTERMTRHTKTPT